jgi:hypothetical protein
MKVGIMQPYFMPYIGYFQLINAVDKFVLLDDVQYINRGWINRNRILMNSSDFVFTLPVKKAARHLNVNERFFAQSFNDDTEKLKKCLYYAYHKAPYYKEVEEVLLHIFSYNDLNISHFIGYSLKTICKYLDITTLIYTSSEIIKNDTLKKQDRIIDINKIMNSTNYINPIGGTELYSKDVFGSNNIILNFIKTKNIVYKQFDNEFIPNLSIIDVMMFNSKEEVKELLKEYELISN